MWDALRAFLTAASTIIQCNNTHHCVKFKII